MSEEPKEYWLPPPSPWAISRTTPQQAQAAREAESARIAKVIKERQARDAKAATERAVETEKRDEEYLVQHGHKAAARREFLLANPSATESGFETYWKRVKPTADEVQGMRTAALAKRLSYGRL